MFRRARVVVFCDGDFWHGRNLRARLSRLRGGHNARYWVAKIAGNVARDKRRNVELGEMGWLVLRFWEGDIAIGADEIARKIVSAVRRRIIPRAR